MSAVLKPIDDDELELLDAKAVSKLFRVPLSWVQQATRSRAKNPLPHVKVGHYTRFQERALREWLEAQKKGYPKRKR